MTTSTASATGLFVEAFEQGLKQLLGDRSTWTEPLRRRAIERFAELGFPTTRDEEWKYTSVAKLAGTPFVVNDAGEVPTDETVRPFLLDIVNRDTIRIVFVDGRFTPSLSSLGDEDGLEITNLAAVLHDPARQEMLEGKLSALASFDDRAFVALNTAFMADGLFLRIAPGVSIERPIEILHLTGATQGPATICHPRNLMIAESGSEARIVETFASSGDGPHFTNAVTEVYVGENAHLDHTKIQIESESAFHIATMVARQERNSRFASRSFSFGGGLTRNDIDSIQVGDGIECTFDGLFVASRKQHVDHHTLMDHAKPHGTSHELYKGILDGQATGVFNGKVMVRQDAQKTDARQSNKNLLLSPDAVIDTKPQLEIFADDVKCAHGATIGQLDEMALFYLRSRGIAPVAARTMLIRAFAEDVVLRVPDESVRTRLTALLDTRLESDNSKETP